jgi:hypothetical protein
MAWVLLPSCTPAATGTRCLPQSAALVWYTRRAAFHTAFAFAACFVHDRRYDAEATYGTEVVLLWVYAASTFASLMFFIVYAIKELSESLGIYCFTITKKRNA